jgi:hypothetical protein
LAFHPYPQVIRKLFNVYQFGPPVRDYRTFTLPMDRSLGFASIPSDSTALLRLAFATLPYLKYLGCQTGITRRLIMQKARCHPDHSGLQPLVSAWFQGLFTPLLRVLFTFPLQYWFAIGLPVVFRLGRWCCRIQTGFLQPRPTQDTATSYQPFTYRTLTSFGRPFHAVLLN